MVMHNHHGMIQSPHWCNGNVMACDNMQVMLETCGHETHKANIKFMKSIYSVNDKALFTLSVVCVLNVLEDNISVIKNNQKL